MSSALRHELVELELAIDLGNETCDVRYGAILLGKIDASRLHRIL